MLRNRVLTLAFASMVALAALSTMPATAATDHGMTAQAFETPTSNSVTIRLESSLAMAPSFEAFAAKDLIRHNALYAHDLAAATAVTERTYGKHRFIHAKVRAIAIYAVYRNRTYSDADRQRSSESC